MHLHVLMYILNKGKSKGKLVLGAVEKGKKAEIV